MAWHAGGIEYLNEHLALSIFLFCLTAMVSMAKYMKCIETQVLKKRLSQKMLPQRGTTCG
jgi:hypothetical protein